MTIVTPILFLWCTSSVHYLVLSLMARFYLIEIFNVLHLCAAINDNRYTYVILMVHQFWPLPYFVTDS